jgi:hypothetical protein
MWSTTLEMAKQRIAESTSYTIANPYLEKDIAGTFAQCTNIKITKVINWI